MLDNENIFNFDSDGDGEFDTYVEPENDITDDADVFSAEPDDDADMYSVTEDENIMVESLDFDMDGNAEIESVSIDQDGDSQYDLSITEFDFDDDAQTDALLYTADTNMDGEADFSQLHIYGDDETDSTIINITDTDFDGEFDQLDVYTIDPEDVEFDTYEEVNEEVVPEYAEPEEIVPEYAEPEEVVPEYVEPQDTNPGYFVPADPSLDEVPSSDEPTSYEADDSDDTYPDNVEISTIDLDGDGIDDATVYAVDTDGDSDIDAVITEIDLDGDGEADIITYEVDTNNDGEADQGEVHFISDDESEENLVIRVSDTDYDGKVDAFSIATDNDLDFMDELLNIDENDDVVPEDETDDGDTPYDETVPEDVPADVPADDIPDDDTSVEPENTEGVVSLDQFDYDPDGNHGMRYEEMTYFDPDSVDPDDVIGDPEDAIDLWECQGDTNRCAIYAQKFIIEEYTGEEVDIEELVDVAEENGWFEEEYGTSLNDMDKLLEKYDVPHETSYGNDINDIAECLDNGQKVIVSVDSEEYWYGEEDGSNVFSPGDGPNHAIEVIGIDNSDPENPMIIVNDSGVPHGAGMAIPADTFMDAWEDGNCQMIACM